MLIFKRGDLFTATTPIAHCISADAVMAKGVARQIKNTYGHVTNLRLQISQLPKHDQVGQVITVKCPQKTVFHLITKAKYFKKPTLTSIMLSLVNLRKYMNSNGYTQVAMPAIACGLDKMVWRDIEYLIRQIFDNSNILVTVYIL